jgi:hypothetical protein
MRKLADRILDEFTLAEVQDTLRSAADQIAALTSDLARVRQSTAANACREGGGMNNDELRAYIESLKVGEKVIETGASCMTGAVGTVYVSDDDLTRGTKCVMWEWPKDIAGMGTSVTHGTRRIKEVLAVFNEPADGRAVVITDEMVEAVYEHITPHDILTGETIPVRRALAAALAKAGCVVEVKP